MLTNKYIAVLTNNSPELSKQGISPLPWEDHIDYLSPDNLQNVKPYYMIVFVIIDGTDLNVSRYENLLHKDKPSVIIRLSQSLSPIKYNSNVLDVYYDKKSKPNNLHQIIYHILSPIFSRSYLSIEVYDILEVLELKGRTQILQTNGAVNNFKTLIKKFIHQLKLYRYIKSAKGVIVNFESGANITLDDTNAFFDVIFECSNLEIKIIWGAQTNPKMENTITIFTLFTGINSI